MFYFLVGWSIVSWHKDSSLSLKKGSSRREVMLGRQEEIKPLLGQLGQYLGFPSTSLLLHFLMAMNSPTDSLYCRRRSPPGGDRVLLGEYIGNFSQDFMFRDDFSNISNSILF